MLMQTRGDDLTEEIRTNPLFEQLDVAARGAVIHDELPPLDRQPAFSYQILSVLSIPYIVENLVPRVEAALDGDSSTEIPDGPPTLPPEWTSDPDRLAGISRA